MAPIRVKLVRVLYRPVAAPRQGRAGASAHSTYMICKETWQAREAVAQHYRVIGGEHAGTDVTAIAGGGGPGRHGPFADHAAARDGWARPSWRHIDDAQMRYRNGQV